MRILLAMPPWSVSDFFTGDLGDDVGGAWHPFSILQLAACLERAGYEVHILDGGFLNRQQFLTALDRIKPDFIGFYTTVFLWYSARDTSTIIKERYPNTKIIIGGPIATAMKDKLLTECPAVDFLCVGEGEELIVEVAKKVEKGDSDYSEVNGLLWRRNGEIVTNPPSCVIEDLDNLPFAARHLINVRAYRPPLGTYKRLPAIYLFTSRGCNGSCIFCWQNKRDQIIRYRSAESVLEEIDQCYRDFHIKEIRFFDDNFTYNYDRAIAIFEGLIKRKYDLTFYCSVRVDNIDKRLLYLMKRAGFWGVMFGVESGNQQDLDMLGKGVTVEQNRQAVRWAHEVGLMTVTPIIFGIPGQTFEMGLNSIKFVLDIGSDIVNFHALTPIPGAELYENVDRYGYLATHDLSEYTFEGIAFVPFTMTREQIEKLRRTAFRRFYSHPKTIIKYLSRLRARTDFEVMYKGVSAMVKSVLNPRAYRPKSMGDEASAPHGGM